MHPRASSLRLSIVRVRAVMLQLITITITCPCCHHKRFDMLARLTRYRYLLIKLYAVMITQKNQIQNHRQFHMPQANHL